MDCYAEFISASRFQYKYIPKQVQDDNKKEA